MKCSWPVRTTVSYVIAGWLVSLGAIAVNGGQGTKWNGSNRQSVPSRPTSAAIGARQGAASPARGPTSQLGSSAKGRGEAAQTSRQMVSSTPKRALPIAISPARPAHSPKPLAAGPSTKPLSLPTGSRPGHSPNRPSPLLVTKPAKVPAPTLPPAGTSVARAAKPAHGPVTKAAAPPLPVKPASLPPAQALNRLVNPKPIAGLTAKPQGHKGLGPSQRSERGDQRRVSAGHAAHSMRPVEPMRLARQGDTARQSGSPHAHGADQGRAPAGASFVSTVHRVLKSPGHPRAIHEGSHIDHHHRACLAPSYYHSGFYFHVSFGPWHLGRPVWYPHWEDWVRWSWHRPSHVTCDPRPVCRPARYLPATTWHFRRCPVWLPLPIHKCGAWVGVARPVVPVEAVDLQLLAIRFVDPGHPGQRLGPRYRVWFRNNSVRRIHQPFNVALVASADGRLAPGLPQAGVRVAAIQAGEIQSVDVRLPFEATRMDHDAVGRPLASATVHILVDADWESGDCNMANNGAQVSAGEILPVDPAAFEVQPGECQPGWTAVIAGEGFGPEPGTVLLRIGNRESEAEILGWYDLGVRIRLPELWTAHTPRAELVVVRADGLAGNPLGVTLVR